MSHILEEFLVVADFARDRIIVPKTPGEYNNLIQFIEKNKKRPELGTLLLKEVQDKCVPHYTQLGGPLPNLSQHLKLKQRIVTGYAAVGNDVPIYLKDLQNLGVDISRLIKKHGPSAECFYILSSPTEHYPPIWFPNACNFNPSRILSRETLNNYGIVIVSGIDFSLAQRILSASKNTKVFNPGSEVLFLENSLLISEILNNTTILSANQDEFTKIISLLEVDPCSPKDLFKVFSSLDYIIITKACQGASIFQRDSEGYSLDLSKFSARTPRNKIVDTIGAGDAFLATAVDSISRHNTLQDILVNATLAAQESLKHRGAYVPKLWEINPTLYGAVSRTE